MNMSAALDCLNARRKSTQRLPNWAQPPLMKGHDEVVYNRTCFFIIPIRFGLQQSSLLLRLEFLSRVRVPVHSCDRSWCVHVREHDSSLHVYMRKPPVTRQPQIDYQ